jgi:hypothetical protein
MRGYFLTGWKLKKPVFQKKNGLLYLKKFAIGLVSITSVFRRRRRRRRTRRYDHRVRRHHLRVWDELR